MNNLGRAAKYAVKDFFKRQTDHKEFIENTGKWKSDTRVWGYPELALLTAVAGIHKHSFAIPGSIMEAIRQGRFRYHDLKEVEQRAELVFATSNLSEESKEKVMRMMRQGEKVSPQIFAQQDSDEFLRVYHELGINGRQYVNF